MLDSYTNYARVFTVAPGQVNLTQDTYRWYQNSDFLAPSSALAGEGTMFEGATHNTLYRLRMNVLVGGSTMNAGETFKLQYATSPGGSWTDVGAIGSGSVWRFADNGSVGNGTTLGSLLLSQSGVAATYQEQNASAATPDLVSSGNRGEWDWVVQDNGAEGNTTYYFRMVTGAGSPFAVYNQYGTIKTATANLNQNAYRWYSNNNTLTPTTAIESENTSAVSIAELQQLRLRIALSASDSPVPTGKSFKLQYSTSVAGPWTDIDPAGGTNVLWRGYDATPANGASVPSNLISGANELGTYR